MSISNYAELKILDHTTGQASWTAPSTVYVKLHTGDPGEDGTSNAATNTTRQAVSWNAASSGSISTSVTITWTNVSTTETYTHWTLWDNASAGNCLWIGALNASAAVSAGDNFEITALSLSLD